jgi:hypothetical protein
VFYRPGYQVSIDIACKFEPWRLITDARAKILQSHLQAAVTAARGAGQPLDPDGQPLDPDAQSLDRDSVEFWGDALDRCADALNARKDDSRQDVTPAAVHAGFKAFLFMLEVYGGIDTESEEIDPSTWPSVSLDGLAASLLPALHAFAHGFWCRQLFDIRGLKMYGRQDGEMVERWNQILNSLIARVASSNLRAAKAAIAELMRWVNRRKVAIAAHSIAASVKGSTAVLAEAGAMLLARARELDSYTPLGATIDECAARTRLTTAALVVAANPAEWAAKDEIIADLNLVEAAHISRLQQHERGTPSISALREVVRRILSGKTGPEVTAAMDAIRVASGDDTLAGETASATLRWLTELSTSGDTDVSTVLGQLQKLGFPESVMDTAGVNDSWESFNTAGILQWAGMRIAVARLSSLAYAIRERRVHILFAQRLYRVIGAAGGHLRTGMYQHGAASAKKKRAELYGWVDTFNKLVVKLKSAVANWERDHVDVPPIISSANLPQKIGESDVKNPNWIPPEIGFLAEYRVDVAFVDTLRNWRTHHDEVHIAGPTRAEILVATLLSRCRILRERVSAADRVLARAGTRVEQVSDARFAFYTRSSLMRKHFPTRMALPVSVDPDDAADRAVMSGYRVLLQREAEQAAATFRTAARATLHLFRDGVFDAMSITGADTLNLQWAVQTSVVPVSDEMEVNGEPASVDTGEEDKPFLGDEPVNETDQEYDDEQSECEAEFSDPDSEH